MAKEGDVRCSECVEQLIHASEAWVRLALISEPSPSLAVIDSLVGDGDVSVNYTARWQRRESLIVPNAATDASASFDAEVPTLREALVASSIKDQEIAIPLVPRYDDNDEW